MATLSVQITEEDRELLLRGLAKLARSSPGEHCVARIVAEKLGKETALAMFEAFSETGGYLPAYRTHSPLDDA